MRRTFEDAREEGWRNPADSLAVLVSARNEDGSIYTLPVGNIFSEAVNMQRFFLAGSGKLTLAAAGNVRGTISNPAGSGRNILVARLAGLGTGTAWARLRVNPTTGLPATAARPTINAIIGGAAPVGILKVDTDLVTPLGGGTDTGIDIGMPASARVSLDMPPMILSPGVSLGINIPFTGAADAALSVYWAEIDV